MATKIKKRSLSTDKEEKALTVVDKVDQQLVNSLLEKAKKHYIEFQGGLVVSDKDKPDLLAYAHIADILSVTNINGAIQILENAAAGQYLSGPGGRDLSLNVALSQVAELDPQNALESMIVSQMIAVNTSIGRVMKLAMCEEQTQVGREIYLNLATKLQRTFLQQVETLQKIRGKGQQTVRVEHVTVNKGGQAMVGTISSGGEG
jgi:hypothetical protein